MGHYGVAGQVRTLAALAPTQMTSLVVPLLLRAPDAPGDQLRVVAMSTFAVVAASVALGGAILLALPLLPLVYGASYQGAVLPAALLVATAIVHMGGAPIVNTLLVANLRMFALIGFLGCALMLASGWALVPRYGAAGAAAAWLIAHAAAQPAANLVLARARLLPPGAGLVWAFGSAAGVALAGITAARLWMPAISTPLAFAQVALYAAAIGVLVRTGQGLGFIPADLRRILPLARGAAGGSR
jgi:O-antigen/teichoic acid export membrane protein